MKQTSRILSTYTADVSGVCSALFELGGMTVMHDASGCNSTYNTHDEPRWYDTDSMVYISALTEMQAIMGDDEKLISDVVSAAAELSPAFIALAGTPIPMMTGMDFPAVAAVIEQRTGIPAFGFATNGMHSYLSGAGMAFEAFARRMTDPNAQRRASLSANLLGATPLDFSVNGSVETMKRCLDEHGIELVSCWAMGSTLAELSRAGEAQVNLVVSYSALPAARALQERFSTPYVVGAPIGKLFSKKLMEDLKTAAKTGDNIVSYTARSVCERPEITIIGESVAAGSLAAAVTAEYGKTVRVLCPVETEEALLAQGDRRTEDEDTLERLIQNDVKLIADPLYRPICPQTCAFYELPHEAFSGRIYRRRIPNLAEKIR